MQPTLSSGGKHGKNKVPLRIKGVQVEIWIPLVQRNVDRGMRLQNWDELTLSTSFLGIVTLLVAS